MLENLALRLASGPKLQLPANAGPGRQLMLAQGIRSLLPRCETWTEFLTSGCGLA